MTTKFIPWHGGQMPVPGNTQVEIRNQAGDTIRGLASQFYWSHAAHGRWSWRNIVAYRVIPASDA